MAINAKYHQRFAKYHQRFFLKNIENSCMEKTIVDRYFCIFFRKMGCG